MLGFVNGLAVVIFLAQLEQFKISSGEGQHIWMAGEMLWVTLALVASTMGLIWLTPKVSRAIPAPLVAIFVVAAVVIVFDLNIPRVGDLASVAGGLPEFHIPLFLSLLKRC